MELRSRNVVSRGITKKVRKREFSKIGKKKWFEVVFKEKRDKYEENEENIEEIRCEYIKKIDEQP